MLHINWFTLRLAKDYVEYTWDVIKKLVDIGQTNDQTKTWPILQ